MIGFKGSFRLKYSNTHLKSRDTPFKAQHKQPLDPLQSYYRRHRVLDENRAPGLVHWVLALINFFYLYFSYIIRLKKRSSENGTYCSHFNGCVFCDVRFLSFRINTWNTQICANLIFPKLVFFQIRACLACTGKVQSRSRYLLTVCAVPI